MTFTPPTSKASTIISLAKAKTRQGTHSPSAAYDDTILYYALNDLNEWFCYWTFNTKKGGMQPFQFLRREFLFNSKANTTLNGAISAGDNSLTVTSAAAWSETPSATAPLGLYLKNSNGHYNFVTFETKVSSVFSDLDTVFLDFVDAVSVHKIYTLPTNYGRPRTLKISETQHYIWLDSEYSSVPPPGFFHTRFLPTKTLAPQNSGKMFLILPENIGANPMTLYYVKKPNSIANADSYVDAPDGIARMALVYKMMEYIWEVRGESSKAKECSDNAEDYMTTFASSQASVDASPIQGPMFDTDEV